MPTASSSINQKNAQIRQQGTVRPNKGACIPVSTDISVVFSSLNWNGDIHVLQTCQPS